MTHADHYRVKAGDMASLARAEADPFQKAEYERLVLAYLRLADQADKNSHSDVVYKTPPIPIHRQAQQQQQPQPNIKKDEGDGTP